MKGFSDRSDKDEIGVGDILDTSIIPPNVIFGKIFDRRGARHDKKRDYGSLTIEKPRLSLDCDD